MTVRLRCIGLANGARGPAGHYLAAYDVHTGESLWTTDTNAALSCPTMRDALELWQSVLPSDPVRSDGKPNRPLTAFSISFEQGTIPADPHGCRVVAESTTKSPRRRRA